MRRHRETQLLRACLQYLRATRRGIFWRQNVGGAAYAANREDRESYHVRFGFAGMSDILGVLEGGTFLAVETKSERGRLTLRQKAFLKLVNDLGAIGLCVRSVSGLHEQLDARLAERRQDDPE